MGWFWGGNTGNDKDPTKSLDPTLKEFLNSQQPRPYVPAEAPPPRPPSPPPPPSITAPATEKSPLPDQSGPEANAKGPPENSSVPSESLFPDGRYAHLWSTYTPQDSITASTTTPLERISSARKDRRDLLHRAALENCAFEHDLQQNCFTSGNVAQRAKARMTMCREETKAFNRCYSLQGKFLQALGYMGRSGSSSDEEEERIQMHADKLYHRMMDYEASVDEARRSGGPVPPLSSVFNAARPAPSIEQLALPAAVEKKIKLPLAELPPHERELSVRAALQEAKMTHLYTEEMREYAKELDEKRNERQRWMSRYFGEPIGKFIIPDPPRGPEKVAEEALPRGPEDLERQYWRNERQKKKQKQEEGMGGARVHSG
jgi:hypothetical protein